LAYNDRINSGNSGNRSQRRDRSSGRSFIHVPNSSSVINRSKLKLEPASGKAPDGTDVHSLLSSGTDITNVIYVENQIGDGMAMTKQELAVLARKYWPNGFSDSNQS
jgi:hypothetical protein